MEVKINFS